MKRKNKEELTLREKCHLVHGNGFWHTHGVRRLNLPGIEMHDGPFGVRQIAENTPNPYDAAPSTCYPSPAALACSWDEDLEREIGESMALEAASKNTSLLLTPGVNIKRNPLCGRNFEYFSEDPLLSGKMGAAFVEGVQNCGVGSCVKHYACNSQESYRNISNSVVDDRALNELYLKPFEIVVKEANPWAIMTSYNLINGVHASDNEYLLKTILRDTWHYKGVAMSDWGGTFDPVDSHNHGLDLEMPCMVKSRTRTLVHAARTGRLDLKALTDSAERMRAMLEKAKKCGTGSYDPEEAHQLAKKAAEKSIVLLRNEDGMLPLSSFSGCCVIGAFAEKPRYQGNGSSFVRTNGVVSFLEAIADKKVPYAKGYDLDKAEPNDALVLQAVDLASKSKKVLLFLGLPDILESEGYDRVTINLPDNQLSLFDAIYSMNQNIVVVLSCGAPVALPFLSETKAVLVDYLAGEAGAEAMRDILLGKVSPSGKLAETWPLHLADVPSFGFYPGFEGLALYKESIFVGYRYYLTAGKDVLFPFGHGLSYARFTYSLNLSTDKIEKRDTCIAEVKVTNRTKRASEVVVELYAEPEKQGAVFKAKRTLIGFKKVSLGPAASATVEFPLKQETFAHYDPDLHRFATESGSYKIQVGESSEVIKAEKTLQVENDRAFVSQRGPSPIYYSLPKEGFAQFDVEFETLLGKVIPMDANRHERPFNMDSTMEEISWTAIGKLIHKIFYKNAFTEDTGESQKAFVSACFEDNTIRGLASGGLGPKTIQGMLDFANGNYIGGLWHMIFGKPKKKRK